MQPEGNPPRIVIHGAGSIGCFIGATWQAAGLPVTFLGREDVQAEIAEHGLLVTGIGPHSLALAPEEVRFVTDPAELGQADIVVLTVKSIATAAAARDIARHARKGVAVISFQNGVSNLAVLRDKLPRSRVIHGMVPFNVARLWRGRWHKGVAGDLVAEEDEISRDLAARIGDRPGRLLLSSDMVGLAWGKLIINLNNAVNALSGLTLLEQLKQRDYRRVVAASMVEALEVLETAGIRPAQIGPIPPKLLPHAIAAPDLIFRGLFLRVQKIDPLARSSMADDFKAGRPTEIDHLNGEVVALARKLGRRAPVNAAIADLVRQAEAGVERQWSAPELRAHVLARHAAAPGFGY